MINKKQVLPLKKKLWVGAIKLPMYSVAIMPNWIGTTIAFAEKQRFDLAIFLTFFFAAIFILVWENFSNDVFDAETGIDKNKHHSLVNLTSNKRLIFWLGNIFLVLGSLGIIMIATWQKDITIIGMIALCCLLGYIYQGPPFRLGYRGLGELLCFFSFAMGVTIAYYSQTQSWSLTSLAAGLIVGISTSIILFCSHFHQVEDDFAAGKKSPIVRLGTYKSSQLLFWIVGSIYACNFLFIVIGIFPIWTLINILSLPVAWKLCTDVRENHNLPGRVSNSKFTAVALNFWSSFLIGTGFLLN